jgi:lipid-A-disaccharide synthase-like uncharacterized protein
MDNELFRLWIWVITPWKIIGFTGVAIFGGRWLVQLVASHLKKKPHFPLLFWYMSLCGSLLCLSYFIFGKNDSVGVFSNLFPATVASYNLYLELRNRKRKKAEAEEE